MITVAADCLTYSSQPALLMQSLCRIISSFRYERKILVLVRVKKVQSGAEGGF